MAGVGTRCLAVVAVANVVPKGEVVAGENSRGVRSLEEEVEMLDLVELGHSFLSLLYALLPVVVLLMLVSVVNDVFFVCAMSFIFFVGRGVYISTKPEDDDEEDEESSESMSIGTSLGLTDAASCTFL